MKCKWPASSPPVSRASAGIKKHVVVAVKLQIGDQNSHVMNLVCSRDIFLILDPLRMSSNEALHHSYLRQGHLGDSCRREKHKDLFSLFHQIHLHISAQEDDVTEGTDLLYICLNIRQYKTHKSSVFFSKGMFYKICEYPRWTSK